MCRSNPETDPRPNRMIRWLKDHYHVTVLGQKRMALDGVTSLALTDAELPNGGSASKTRQKEEGRGARGKRKLPKWMNRLRKLPVWLLHGLRLLTRRYDAIISSMSRASDAIVGRLAERRFDLIISHDCSLLPLAFRIAKRRTPVLLDAREYYPRNFDDQLRWRLLSKPVNLHLCKKYLSQCDKIITVSDGLAREYAREFGVEPEVITSLPAYHDISPVPVNPEGFRIIYHGHAGYSRRTEVMVDLMDFVDGRFSLDLMLVRSPDPYVQKVIALAEERDNVRVIPPVVMNEIIPFTSQYDIGLFLCPPTNFNLKYTLPNKLFEFIQARLVVAIGPSIEMRKIVEEYDCGIVSRDFSPRSMAVELNKLDVDKIMYYKMQSHHAAQELNADVNGERVREIVQELIAG